MLEELVSGAKALKNPWIAFFVGAVFTFIAILLSRLVFPAYASMVMVFLTVLILVPLVYAIARTEFERDSEISDPGNLLLSHKSAVAVYTFLFLGITFCFVVVYMFFPAQLTNDLFSSQIGTIQSVVSRDITGDFSSIESVLKIFFNNFKVLAFSVLFSFIYGVGFIFVIVWNASVIGAAIGNVVRVNISNAAASAGNVGVQSYFSIVSAGVFTYMTHGVAEIVAYIIAGLAGSIISISVVKNGFSLEKMQKSFLDVADLILVSVLLMFVAAIIEVYVTPVLF